MAVFVTFSRLPVAAMAIYPFILLKRKEYRNNEVLINHEKIHHRQQVELLFLPFYILYLASYLANLIRFKSHHQAYMNIIFEKEAFVNENNLTYLATRKAFASFKKVKC